MNFRTINELTPVEIKASYSTVGVFYCCNGMNTASYYDGDGELTYLSGRARRRLTSAQSRSGRRTQSQFANDRLPRHLQGPDYEMIWVGAHVKYERVHHERSSPSVHPTTRKRIMSNHNATI